MAPCPPTTERESYHFTSKASKYNRRFQEQFRTDRPLSAPWGRYQPGKNYTSNKITKFRREGKLKKLLNVQDPRGPPKDATHSYFDLDEMPDDVARATEVEKLLHEDTPELSAYSATHLECPLEFQLVRSAAELKDGELEACLEMVEHTSGDDYRASSIGWKPKQKKEEMMDKAMMYLLVRHSDVGPQAEETAENGQQDNDVDYTLEDKGKRDGPPLNALEGTRVTDSDEDNSAPEPIVEHPNISPPKSASPLPNNTGRILGFMSFMFTNDDPPHQDREVVYMYEIHLLNLLRGRGLGSNLVKFLERVASQSGISKTMLTVFTANKGARRLYEKLGYVKDACSPEDRVVRKRVIEADYVIMSKELA